MEKIQDIIERITYKYEVILYSNNQNNAYIAEVPELAWYMSDGATMRKM